MTAVRRCAGCGAIAAVQVNHYERRRLFGLVSGGASDTGDWVCQTCGRSFTLHATPWIWAIAVIPALMGLGLAALLALSAAASAVSGGLSAAWPGWVGAALLGGTSGGIAAAFSWPAWVRLRNPAVPDAVAPEIRFRETVPRRRCGCGKTARCNEVTASRVNGIYTGTEYGYVCECGRTFSIESPLSMGLMLGGGAFLAVLGWICVPSAGAESWSAWALPLGLGGVGVVAMVLMAWRAMSRLRFAVVRPAEP